MMDGMEVLGSRILLRPTQLHRSHRFYRDTLGLAIYRQFGDDDAPGIVFFLGNGLLEISGQATEPPGDAIALWLQVRDIRAEHRRLLDAGVTVLREPRRMACASSWSRSRRSTRSAETRATSPLPPNDPPHRLTRSPAAPVSMPRGRV
jgi:catechol 2,3-dioxygenase-like lactoylglutathione lyase family enzyme